MALSFVLKVKECAEKAELSTAPGMSVGAAAKPAAAGVTSTDGAKKEAAAKKAVQKQPKSTAKPGESAKLTSAGVVSTL